jgi:hypothetical protein
LRGNEEVEISVIFAPIEAIKYTYKLKLKTFPIGGIPNRVIDARQPGGVRAPECLQSFSINLICPGYSLTHSLTYSLTFSLTTLLTYLLTYLQVKSVH